MPGDNTLDTASGAGQATSLDPYTQHLLQLAQDQGGAVAQVAAQTVHPNGSFLSIAQDKLGNAFHGVMDALATPEETVAALMSGTDFGTAYKERLMPSQVLFGKGEASSAAGKAGMFAVKFLTDALLDPMTYATFGEYDGVLGLSKLAQIPVKEETARALGMATKAITNEAGEVVNETVRHHALSKFGVAQLGKTTSHIEDTIKKDTLEQFNAHGVRTYSAAGLPSLVTSSSNIRGRIGQLTKTLVGKSSEDIAKTLANPIRSGAELTLSEGAEFRAASLLASAVKDAKLAVKPAAEMTAEESDAWRHAINTSTDQAMQEASDRLVRHTIQARRQDIDLAAKESLSRLIETSTKNAKKLAPTDEFGNKVARDIAQSYFDKGGMKVFGQSVISGVRIRSAISMLKPLEDWTSGISPFADKSLDEISKARNLVSSMFSTKWNAQGRIPDSALEMMRNAKNKEEAQMWHLIAGPGQLLKKMGLTPEESKLIYSAIAGDRPPADSPNSRLSTLWALLHTSEGQKVGAQIAAGTYGGDQEKMWKAAIQVKKQLKQNLLTMHASGMAAFPQKNYVPLLMNEPKTVVSPYSRFLNKEAVNAQKGELNKWVNVKDPAKVFYGTQDAAKNAAGETVSFDKFARSEERQRIETELDRTVMNSESKKQKLTDQIEKLWNSVSEKQVKSILRGSKAALGRNASDDLFNQLALERVVREAVPKVDRERILKEYADKYYSEAGNKLTTPAHELTPEDIERLREDLSYGDEELDSIAQHLVGNIEDLGIKRTPAPTPGSVVKAPTDAYQKTLAKLRTAVMEAGINSKKRYLAEALEGSNFKDVVAGLSEAWHKDPGAIGKTMEAILGKEHELSTTMEDLSDTKRGLEEELKQPGLKMLKDKWFYMDKAGETYKRVRATAEEINKNLYDSKEMFSDSAFKSMLHESLNVLRSTNTKYLIEDMAKKFGVPASQAPSDFVKVSIAGLSKQEGDLASVVAKDFRAANEDLYYEPTVAHAMADMMRIMDKDPASGELAHAYDTLTNLFKSSVTTIFPAFYGRNALSNVWQSMMDIGYHALSPAKHMMAVQLQMNSHELENLFMELSDKPSAETLKKITDLSNKVILTDKRGYKWTVGELDRVLKDNVVGYHPSISGMMDTGRTSQQMLADLESHLYAPTNKWGSEIKDYYKFWSQDFKPFQAGRNLAYHTESQPRILNFLANLENTGDVSFAAYQTKQFLYDHTNLTHFERNFMRRIIPFYTYTRKNLEGMVQTLIHKPGRIDAFRNTYSNIGDVMGGGPISDQERQLLPKWMRDSLDMVIKRNNGNVTLLRSMGTPFEAPFDELGNLFGSLNPIIKGPVEAATGYSFFEGKPLSQVTDATAFVHAPQAVKDFIGFTTKTYTDKAGNEHTLYISLKPSHMNLFQNLPFTSRTLTTLGELQKTNISGQNKLLENLIGIKPTEVDMGNAQYEREKELDQKLEQILSTAGVGYTRQDYAPPRGTKLPKRPSAPGF